MAALKNLAVPVLTIGALALGAGPAGAEVPEPFTITETIDFEAEEFSFTATGSLCPSGTFEDEVKTFAAGDSSAGKLVLLIRTEYICGDGSGTFDALKHVVITFTGEAADGLGIGRISGILVR